MGTKSTHDDAAYPPPVDRLLGLGSLFTRGREWRDYLRMGLGPGHVPDLVRLACDMDLNHGDQDDPRVYAPLHAWRALGQLAPPEAAPALAALLTQLPDDDFANEDLPEVLGMIGAASVEPVCAVLANAALPEGTRISAASALEEIGKRHPELRDRCVAALIRQLERWAEQPDDLNGFLIHDLAELGAVEAAPLMQAVFDAGRADTMIRGDWEDVQVDLGLLPERVTPPRPPDWLARMKPRSAGAPAPVAPGAAAREKRRQDKRRKAERASHKRRK